MKTGIFYGSTTGRTAGIAEDIAKAMGIGEDDVHDIAKSAVEDAKAYDAIILGSSTWGLGELQEDWENALDSFSKSDLSGKKVAVFGCGDSSSFPDTFCDAVGLICEALSGSGCTLVGAYAPEGYEETESKVCVDGKFMGLAIDDSDDSKTQERIASWAAQLKSEL